MTAVTLWASSTSAQSTGAKVRLSFAAPGECPSRDDFVARLAARASSIRIAAPDDAEAPSAIASLTRDGTAFHGVLRLDRPGVAPSVRDVPGATCSDVADALALILALALAPGAGTESTSEVAISDADTAAAPSPSASPAPSASDSPVDAPPSLPLDEPQPYRERPLPLGRVVVGVEGRAMSGLSPDLLGAIAGFVELGSARDAALSPALELAVLAGTSGSVTAGSGDVTFWAAGVAARGCPYRLRIGDAVVLSPCATLDALVLTIQAGAGIPDGVTRHRPWLSPGVAAKIVILSLDPFRLEVFGGLSSPIFRDRVYLRPEPGTTIHRPDWVAAATGIAVAYRFQ